MRVFIVVLSIVLLCPSFVLKDKIIKGKVVDKNGKPLKGVPVLSYYEKANGAYQDKKTYTDAKGNYRIEIADKDKILHFAYRAFGYTKVTRINHRKRVDIVLFDTPSNTDTIAIGINIY